MRLDQRAGAGEERGAVGGEPDRARRALDAGACQAALSSRCSFMLTAACVVPSASAARVKLCEVGDQQEGLHGRDIEGGSH